MNSVSTDRAIELLSAFLIPGYRHDLTAPPQWPEFEPELEELATMSEEGFDACLALAHLHHVPIRFLRLLELTSRFHGKGLQQSLRAALEKEEQRIEQAVLWLSAIVETFEASGCPVVVIKSLDHWPDLGSDLDLFTTGASEQVLALMQEKLHARVEPRSWGDRLAGKWNFRLCNLPELVEVHVRYLGQTGEQKELAKRVVQRKVNKTVRGRKFAVPAPEEQILISTLQRMYRHFYFRLCDIIDVAQVVDAGAMDFAELRRGAELGGIWPGVASFLFLVSQYITSYRGRLEIPREVLSGAYSPDLRLHFRGDLLRVPMHPAAGLYGSQLLSAGRHRNLRAMSRLPLLPPLALSALLAYRLTGSDKGIW